ncbi:hypothetical protein [Halocynthiibacter namhaensis]|uniref:hypothetical protein n=2 Tax=Halocynthiibacter namhaensis TaxID=1290553 RepID=UPI0005790B71|nr:hypothetical protein [Halocynthiibacter namhaensis]
MTTYEYVVNLAKQGCCVDEIIHESGVKLNTVNRYLSRARQQGVVFPDGLKVYRKSLDYTVPKSVRAMILPYAKRRKMSVSDLAAKLITTIAEDELIDAVLDDGKQTYV